MLSQIMLAILGGASSAAWITGTLGAGNVLTSNLAPSIGTAATWQWKRNGTNIAGATASAYAQVTADVGTTVSVVINGTYAASVSIPAVPPVFSAAAVITSAGTTNTPYTAATLSNSGIPAASLFHDLYANGVLLVAAYVSGATYATQAGGVSMTLVPRAVQGGTTVTGPTSAAVAVTAQSGWNDALFWDDTKFWNDAA